MNINREKFISYPCEGSGHVIETYRTAIDNERSFIPDIFNPFLRLGRCLSEELDMKQLFLLFLLVSLPLISPAQTEQDKELSKEFEKYEALLKNQKLATLSQKKEMKKVQEKLGLLREKFALFEKYEENFAQARTLALTELDEKVKSIPFFKRRGAKASFYRCLRSSLEKSHMTYDTCQKSHPAELSDEEIASGKVWKEAVGFSLKDAIAEKNRLPKEIEQAENEAASAEETYKKFVSWEKVILNNLKSIQGQKADQKLVPKYAHVNNCDQNTPVVNLEEEVPFEGADFKGAFHGIPRDNQGNLGTCYANVAKNFVVGLSGGKDVASFIDMALHYKDGLNSDKGGDSCETLKVMKEIGYCPDKFSPMETAEKSLIGESLFDVGSQAYLADNVAFLKQFISNIDEFEKSASEIDKGILLKAKSVIDILKANQDIQLPLPIVKNQIPVRQKLFEAYHAHKDKLGISEVDFFEAYNEQYKKFYPQYLKAVLENKSLDEIFEVYKKEMDPFFTKYNLKELYPDFKDNFKLSSGKDFIDPKLQHKLRVSVNYLKEVLDKKDLADSSFIDFCSDTGFENRLNFLGSLFPLVEKMRKDKLNGDLLFDINGKLKSPQELMQLAVAPACINKENRQEIPAFSCKRGDDTIANIKNSDKPYDEKVKMVRERVVLSLMQGYPLGNTFSKHINSIVGIRFNKSVGKCEYRIRDSQNGTSDWQDERLVFDKMKALTEVRKK
jgi:hypothetical protein